MRTGAASAVGARRPNENDVTMIIAGRRYGDWRHVATGCIALVYSETRMWANAQRYGRPARYRWHPLFNAAKFGQRPLLECRAVTLPRRESR